MIFFEVVKYLMFGALIASIVQVTLPRNLLIEFNSNKALSIIILMLFAYLISLCSTSDSFVGKSLLTSFTTSSVVAYLLLGNYKKSFVITLISLIFITIFIISLVVIKV